MVQKNTHLVVFVHGLWGNHAHVSKPAHVLQERYERDMSSLSRRLHVLLAKCNENDRTYDGVDVMGERLVHEIHAEIRQIEKEENSKVDQFSIVGYSLGGLISRYAIGVLYTEGFFDNVKPMAFTTFCTPHLGSYRKDWSGLRGAVTTLGPKVLSRTGTQLFVQDNWHDEQPLLTYMAEPGSSFHNALMLFVKRRMYSAINNDQTVPYWTATATGLDPFSDDQMDKLDMTFHPEYPTVLIHFQPNEDTDKKSSSHHHRHHHHTSSTWKDTARKSGAYAWFGVVVPVLLPLFLGVAAVKVTRDGYRSRRRIQSVTNGSYPPLEKKDLHIGSIRFNSLMSEALDEMAGMTTTPNEIVNEVNNLLILDQEEKENHLLTKSNATIRSTETMVETGNIKMIGKKPQLLPSQERMIEGLNTDLRWDRYAIKVPAYNAHGVVVLRFNYGPHDEAMIGLRHFADHFVLD